MVMIEEAMVKMQMKKEEEGGKEVERMRKHHVSHHQHEDQKLSSYPSF